ncbi:lysophospholipid acyltransferase family protein [Micromonospora humida]|uniref:1-acyl-sn-glycerol-3-phosphate acyltransferase n=1 Tax=Micromonospora humida TaxID=2809018 RepID=A0ABS2J032_9ACTN|nr:lysophospholipid acyltransferase family protein [Micromonospora humida]MBM7079008.1 1-acyl-sn-glycerol-3-phosphate acyltransferase [Micromonospora humida]
MSAELWRPTAGCGPDCLPGEGRAGVSSGRQVARLVGVLGMLLAGAGLTVLLPVLPAAWRAAVLRAWARRTAGVLGVRLVVRGRLPRRRALLVANHVSWLDVFAVLAVAPARLLAKREVRSWPVLGLLARAGGTVFVDRSRPRDLPRTVARLAAILRAGHPVTVFPEGTTWCGIVPPAACRPRRGFRPAVFQAAVDAGAPVVPLRISYRCAATGATTTTAAFLGDDTLWRSVRRVLAARDLVVDVAVTAALHPVPGADRRVLARAAESAVHLLPPRPAAGRPTLAVLDPVAPPGSVAASGPVAAPGSVAAPAVGAGLGLAA